MCDSGDDPDSGDESDGSLDGYESEGVLCAHTVSCIVEKGSARWLVVSSGTVRRSYQRTTPRT